MREGGKDWDDAIRWADEVLDREARAGEHLTDDELRDRSIIGWAEDFMLADGWVIAHPDDPAMRRYLIGSEGLPEDFADAVLAKMRELGAERGLL